MLAESTPFDPHVEHGVGPDKLLDKFCCERGDTFLGAVRLMNQFGSLLLEEGAEIASKRANLFEVSCGARYGTGGKRAMFLNCPLVWDTGASYGLTPF